MANNRLILDGLADLRAALRRLPADLTEDGAEIVDNTTEVTASSLKQSYPLGDTGKLRNGVRVSVQRGPFGVVGTVLSTSPHAHLWEFGTQSRRTQQGWSRGKSPAHRNEGLVAIAQRQRRRMHQKLIELVRRAGFQVTGAL